jgi:hypothetical protein
LALLRSSGFLKDFLDAISDKDTKSFKLDNITATIQTKIEAGHKLFENYIYPILYQMIFLCGKEYNIPENTLSSVLGRYEDNYRIEILKYLNIENEERMASIKSMPLSIEHIALTISWPGAFYRYGLNLMPLKSCLSLLKDSCSSENYPEIIQAQCNFLSEAISSSTKPLPFILSSVGLQTKVDISDKKLRHSFKCLSNIV